MKFFILLVTLAVAYAATIESKFRQEVVQIPSNSTPSVVAPTPELVPAIVDPNPITIPPNVTSTTTTTAAPETEDSSEEEDEDEENEENDDNEEVEENEENNEERQIYIPGYVGPEGELLVPLDAVSGGQDYEVVGI